MKRLKSYILIIAVMTFVFTLTGCSSGYSQDDLVNAEIGYTLKGLEYGMNLDEVSKKLSVTMDKSPDSKNPDTGEIYNGYSCKVNLMGTDMTLVAKFKEDKLVSTTFVLEDEAGLEKKYEEFCEKLEKSIELSDEQKVDSVQDGSTLYSSQVFRRADHANGTSLFIAGFKNAEGITEKIEISLNTINNM